MSQDSQNIISGHSHTFDTGIAETLGLHAAIVFNHIVYWLKINCRKENANFQEGKYWMYETQKQMADFFGYLKEDDIWKAIKKLLEAGLLIKDNFNKNPFDKTSWYTTSNQEIFLGKKAIKEKITKPLISGMGDAQQRDPQRSQAECIYVQEDNQKDKQKEHHLDGDEFFSKIEEDEIKQKYSQSEIEEAKKITLEKCKTPEARKKYFRTVLENFKINRTQPIEKNKYSSHEMVKFPYQDFEKKVNPNVEANISTAYKFIIEKEWGSLFVRDHYVEDKRFTGKDISLNMNPIEFEASLNRLYDSLHR
jgi:hypothetical protein